MSMLAEIRCPLVLAVPPGVGGAEQKSQTHRCTDSHNDEQTILCSLVGSHKFKPKSQYNGVMAVFMFAAAILAAVLADIFNFPFPHWSQSGMSRIMN